jgi:predicted enzyme related to lactoylglutathione lyase
MMQVPHDVRPGYIGIDDVDAAVAGINADGGTLRMPARDLTGVGRIAMVTDPQGAPFYVMHGAVGQPSTCFDANAVGHCAWNKLATHDLDAAVDFYADQFGWTRGELLPVVDMSGYQLMLLGNTAFGAIMTSPGDRLPMWIFYFRVPTISQAAQRVREGGGVILHGPTEVPGGDHIIVGTDPQSAVFALVAKL